MTFDQYIYLLSGLVFAGALATFVKGYFKNKKILKYFHDLRCYDEKSAKNIDDLLYQKSNQDLKLMPYVKMFRKQMMGITNDKRLYLNVTACHKQKIKDVSFFLIVCVILLGIVGLTILN